MAHLQGQDWNVVTFGANKKPKKTGNAERDAAVARQSGLEVETVRKGKLRFNTEFFSLPNHFKS